MKSFVFWLLCLFLPFTQPVWGAPEMAPGDSLRISHMRDRIESLRKTLKIPGLSVAIIRNDSVIYADGFGLRDLENKLPATANTAYPIASLTKTFASTLLLSLVEEGKLDLNTPMRQFFPEMKGDTPRVLHYFSHTGDGIAGTHYAYSDSNFAKLTRVLETLSGQSFRDLLVSRIIEPLGMEQTTPRSSNGALNELAHAYRLNAAGQMLPSRYPGPKINTGSGIITTVLDLAKYYIAVDQHRFVSAKTQELAWSPFIANNGTPQPYGFGWFVQNYRGGKLVWHYGEIESFSSLVLKVPTQKLTFILLANASRTSEPFDLGVGNVLRSPFAQTFLENFAPSL
ncbi:MAG: beta-lactamase family protein [Anaerolineae bacterium]|nr:beta-lactamase family protein [Gloeobacterales cyanobacterium ES-bin-313]